MNLDVHCLFSAIVIRSLARRKRKANRQHEQQTVMHSKRLSVHIPSESTYQSNAKTHQQRGFAASTASHSTRPLYQNSKTLSTPFSNLSVRLHCSKYSGS
jgi:hypothetical protein